MKTIPARFWSTDEQGNIATVEAYVSRFDTFPIYITFEITPEELQWKIHKAKMDRILKD